MNASGWRCFCLVSEAQCQKESLSRSHARRSRSGQAIYASNCGCVYQKVFRTWVYPWDPRRLTLTPLLICPSSLSRAWYCIWKLKEIETCRTPGPLRTLMSALIYGWTSLSFEESVASIRSMSSLVQPMYSCCCSAMWAHSASIVNYFPPRTVHVLESKRQQLFHFWSDVSCRRILQR